MSSSDLSSYSSSFYSVSSNPKQTNEYDNYLQHHHYQQQLQQQQNPLQDFIVDVLQNQSLPTYDEGKKNLKKSWHTFSLKNPEILMHN